MFKKIKSSQTFLPSGFEIYDGTWAQVGKNKWFGGDHEKLFKEHCKKFPSDWYYRTHEVNYTVNSLGYRAPEFSSIKWEESIVIFGCSTVFGIGVDDSETISSYLQDITNIPVINLGSGGKSINFIHHNSIILSEFYKLPLAVVIIWPNFSRFTMYKPEVVVSLSSASEFANFWSEYWLGTEHNAETYAYFARLASKNIFGSKCIYYDLSWDEDTADILGCENYPKSRMSYNLLPVHKARDGVHQPSIQLKDTAKLIAKNLFKQGLNFSFDNLK